MNVEQGFLSERRQLANPIKGVKLPTVRTQLSSLYAKTGTRGQAELAQRVLRVAALVH